MRWAGRYATAALVLSVPGLACGAGTEIVAGDEAATTMPPNSTTHETSTTVEGDTPILPAPGLTYEVTGSGSALITYGVAELNEDQERTILPWSRTLQGPEEPTYPFLLAERYGSGATTCRILRGETVLTQQTSNEDDVRVICELPAETRRYPLQARQTFYGGCVAAGGDDTACECILREIEAEYSLIEFVELDEKILDAGQPPPELMALQESCAGASDS